MRIKRSLAMALQINLSNILLEVAMGVTEAAREPTANHCRSCAAILPLRGINVTFRYGDLGRLGLQKFASLAMLNVWYSIF